MAYCICVTNIKSHTTLITVMEYIHARFVTTALKLLIFLGHVVKHQITKVGLHILDLQT
jgi:hypothetical protein